jgi:hypothetical protein
MDPTEALRRILANARRVLEAADGDVMEINACDAIELADNARALDHWLRSGGFLPEPWRPFPGVRCMCETCKQHDAAATRLAFTKGCAR